MTLLGCHTSTTEPIKKTKTKKNHEKTIKKPTVGFVSYINLHASSFLVLRDTLLNLYSTLNYFTSFAQLFSSLIFICIL